MVSYLADLMAGATDFSWQGAKAAHVILMCKMVRGTVQWEDGDRIDQIRRFMLRSTLLRLGKIGVGNATKNLALQEISKQFL